MFSLTYVFYLNPDELSQVLCHYPFMISLDRCNRTCNTLDDLSVGMCVSDKTLDVN